MLRGALALAAACITVQASADTVRRWPDKPTPLSCDVGPDKRIIAGNEWLVFACDDGASIVIISAEGNPASPFVFSFIQDLLGKHHLRGEGNGDKIGSKAAFDELSAWSSEDIEQARNRAIAAKAAAMGESTSRSR
ncbi:hypothetical protein [Erythrobacter sp. CCH5-A1]|jgi:hypothetical protein|uniref:hypothetical protein n=1 Tax=Erythrobacter sp. CCH5-A1 TaxID=1768792 RepID=UPI000835B5BC|nr:hypothetical protein [Erythrobacter sp. CCH5-A1]